MVHLKRSANLEAEPQAASSRVKLELEDPLEEEDGHLNKRSKPSLSPQLSLGNGASSVPPSQYNPLDEPSPLGLQLRKSPSLLDLIQMRLSQGSTSSAGTAQGNNQNQGNQKEIKHVSISGTTEKLKASNFPASLLRIGDWKYKSRYEGDLVAKCYFAKHKLVWEVLEGGLKSKIEIQWSDIMGLKANCPDNGPGTLNILLAKQPLFFRETNPQPRKHTLWQATADFTNGQASIHRQHFLQCPQGLLNKHFEKLIQCDLRLNFLSHQPEIVLDSPFFEPRPSLCEAPKAEFVSSPTASSSSSFSIGQQKPTGKIALQPQPQEAPSPSSVMDSEAIEGNGSLDSVNSSEQRNCEQIKIRGLHQSMSMGDLMDHIGQCLLEQTGDAPSEKGPEFQEMLAEIARHMLGDTQFNTASDEKLLMSRINSLGCLLQRDSESANLQVSAESLNEVPYNGKDGQCSDPPESENCKIAGHVKASEEDAVDVSDSEQSVPMSREDSFSDLLLHLPRIASLPKLLFNISEDAEDKRNG